MGSRSRRGTSTDVSFDVEQQSGNIENVGGDKNVYIGGSERDIAWLGGAGIFSKILFVLGFLLGVGGFGVFALGIFGGAGHLDPRGGFPAPIAIGFGMVAGGIVLMGLARLVSALSGRS